MLAASLTDQLGCVHVELDRYVFVDQAGRRRELSESVGLIRQKIGSACAVIEGCYADLMQALATEQDHLIWLDIPVEQCIENARNRQWEAHKWASRESQEDFLPRLLDFIAGYSGDDSPTGRPGHAKLFGTFPGTTERRTESLP